MIESGDLVKRLSKGLNAQVFNQIVQIFIRLGEVPIYLGYWGTQKYGEWLILAAIPTYLAMTDGGFSQTSCREITMRASKGDRSGAVCIYQSTWLLLLFISAIVIGLSLLFCSYAPINQWFNFETISVFDTKVIIFMFVLSVLLGFQNGILNSGFWAIGKYAESMFLSGIIQLLNFVGSTLPLFFGGEPIYAAICFVIFRLIGTLLLFYFQRKTCPWLVFGFKNTSFSEIRKLIKPSFASLAFPLGVALNLQGIRLIIGYLLGPSAVPLYSTLRTLSNLVVQPRQIVNQITEPELALAYGSGNSVLFKNIFLKGVRFSFWACSIVGILLIPIGKIIYKIWTVNQVGINWPIFILLIISAVINSIWYAALMVTYSTNRHGKNALYYLVIYGGVYVVFSFVATRIIGLVGPALVLVFIEMLMAYLVVRQAMKLTETPLSLFLSGIISPPIFEVKEIFKIYFSKLNRSVQEN